MTEEKENPKLYLITGHQGAGKTEGISSLLPDHPFSPTVYQHNAKMREAHEQHVFHTDSQDTYRLKTSQAVKELSHYIDQQIQRKENIYIEIDITKKADIDFYENLTKIKLKQHHPEKKDLAYDTHAIYLLCDTYFESQRKAAAKNPDYDTYSGRMEIIDHHELTVRSAIYSTYKCEKQVFYHQDGKPALALHTHKGKVIQASPLILNTEYCRTLQAHAKNDINSHIRRTAKAAIAATSQKKITAAKKGKKPQI